MQIVSTSFPEYQGVYAQAPPSKRSSNTDNGQSAPQNSEHNNDKENAAPAISSCTELDYFGQPKQHIAPPDLCIALHTEILYHLKLFPDYPPHTIQRLAELVLFPKRSYQFLQPYLHALRRVVSVSSNVSVFPLPFQQPTSQLGSMGMMTSGEFDTSLGSDESLGGALLTPIPWIISMSPSSSVDRELRENAQRLQDQQALQALAQNGIIDGNETVGTMIQGKAVNNTDARSQSVTTGLAGREDGAVTQGELLRLEQEAGIVSIGYVENEADAVGSIDDDTASRMPDDSHEIPHARGPDEIGIEDVGPSSGTGGIAGLMEAKSTLKDSSMSEDASGMELDEGPDST